MQNSIRYAHISHKHILTPVHDVLLRHEPHQLGVLQQTVLHAVDLDAAHQRAIGGAPRQRRQERGLAAARRAHHRARSSAAQRARHAVKNTFVSIKAKNNLYTQKRFYINV